MIIAFIGTVGSGKSTQMRLLASDLRRRKAKVKISFLKTGHLFAYVLEIILARMLTSKRRDVYPIRALIEEKPNIFKKIFKLWLILDIISVAIKFLFSIYVPLKLGYKVLVEEYIPATVSDYIYLSKIADFSLNPRCFAITFLMKLIHLSGPTWIVFLDAEDNELKRRWKVSGKYNERSDYINMQRTILLRISRKLSSGKLLYLKGKTVKENYQLIEKWAKSVD